MLFRSASVATSRGKTEEEVLANFGQGRTKLAQEAVDLGMADRVATIDQVLQEFAGLVEERQQLSSGVLLPIYGVVDRKEAGQYETRDAIRGYLGLVAQAETDPAGISEVAQAETDPVGPEQGLVAQAETDPVGEVDPVSSLKQRTRDEAQRARDERVRLTKEMLS